MNSSPQVMRNLAIHEAVLANFEIASWFELSLTPRNAKMLATKHNLLSKVWS